MPTILLTDTARFALGARLGAEFAKIGIKVVALCSPKGHPLAKARGVQRILPYSSWSPLASLESAIRAVQPALIIPSDDRAVQHLHELHSRILREAAQGNAISAVIERSLGPCENYPVVSARHGFLNLAREQGVRVPATELIRTPEDLSRWRAAHRPPWILKSDGSWGGSGVRITHTAGESEEALTELTQTYKAKHVLKQLIVNRDSFGLRPWLRGTKPAVTVQAYVEGGPANCVVACWQGKVLAGIAVNVVSTNGPSGTATMVRIADSPEMFDAARKITGRLRLSGIVGLDFVIEKETGLHYLIEMNPRIAPPCHLRLGKGRDLVGALAAQLTSEPFAEAAPATEADLIAYFPNAIQAGTPLPSHAYLDRPQDEPELVNLLLNPWPNRTLPFRLYDYVHRKRHP